MRAAIAVLLSLASAALAQKTPLKSDQTVTNPVGFGLARPYGTLALCQTAGYAAAYADSISVATLYCKNAYDCPAAFPIFYAPMRGLDACSCSAAPPAIGGWQASCDLAYNGLCGCTSPNLNPDPSTIEINLTPEESQMLAEMYARLSAVFSARLKAAASAERAAVLESLAQSLRAFHSGNAFQAAISSRQNGSVLSVSLAPALTRFAPGSIAAVTVSADGNARIVPRANLPGGVARGLSTAFATAIAVPAEKQPPEK